jgi:hypothetical protein
MDLTDQLRKMLNETSEPYHRIVKRAGWDDGGCHRFRTAKIDGITLRTAERCFQAMGYELILRKARKGGSK